MPIFYELTAILLASWIWFDYFEGGFWIKRLKGIPPQKHVKPWDCFTCTNFHIGWILSSIALGSWTWIFGWDWMNLVDTVFIIVANYHIGHVIDHIKYT